MCNSQIHVHIFSRKDVFSNIEYRLFYRALLQKRPIILRSLLIVATPYQASVTYLTWLLYLWHDSFTCDMTHGWHDSFVWGDMTRSYGTCCMRVYLFLNWAVDHYQTPVTCTCICMCMCMIICRRVCLCVYIYIYTFRRVCLSVDRLFLDPSDLYT